MNSTKNVVILAFTFHALRHENYMTPSGCIFFFCVQYSMTDGSIKLLKIILPGSGLYRNHETEKRVGINTKSHNFLRYIVLFPEK